MENEYYDFQEQLTKGQIYEGKVKDYLEREMHMSVETTDMDLQRLGIDFITRSQYATMSVEVKSDTRAHQTGNAFIETVSVEKDGVVEKRGWVYTTCAQILIYYVVNTGELYFIDMSVFKRVAAGWATGKYPERSIPNKTYIGRGLLVPLSDIRNYAFMMRNIDTGT